jgi:two-component system chemotaxis response regulator CheY
MKSETTDHILPLCLVIDESPIVRKLTSIFISPLGFRTAEAETSNEGLKACEANKPNLVIIDWHMPDINGELFLSKLPTVIGNKVPPIIVTSVEYKSDIFKRAHDLGITGFLYKPFTKDMLLSVLDQAHLIPKKRHRHEEKHSHERES